MAGPIERVSEERDRRADGPVVTTPVRGVVRRPADVDVYDVGRVAAGPVLAPFVEHLWWVRSAVTDRAVLAGGIDPAWAVAGDAVLAADVPERLEVLREHLARRPVAPDDEYLGVRATVDAMAADPSRRVEDLAASAGCSTRTLQRRFARLVGVSPEWVLTRYRLQETALELENDPHADLAEVAHRLGWYDQSHLAADLRRTLGTTPGRYARAARDIRGP